MTSQPPENSLYATVGADYNMLDPFKRACQAAALRTSHFMEQHGFEVLEWSRGESAFLLECMWADFILAHVEEGLGTKNMVAEAMSRMAVADEIWHSIGLDGYANVAQCNVAMALNDLITLGARAMSYAFHLAVGDNAWFKDESRQAAVINGIERACSLAQCTWGGGETPTLQGIVYPETVLLSGSAVGIVDPKSRLIKPINIRHGDVIVIFKSSGIHANGLSVARRIAAKVGYDAKLDDGRAFGEALLDPTILYGPYIAAAQDAGINFHYLINITGHGWRKLMRAVEPFVYMIETLPEAQSVFRGIAEWGALSSYDMYNDFNMGGGFAAILPADDAKQLCKMFDLALIAGYVEKRGDQKKVILQQRGIEFDRDTLGVR
jgi:phosphoribosylformylglycinamidine cyclo-ligase